MATLLGRTKAGGRAGRPTIRTPERIEKFLTAIKLGATRKAACGYAGFSEDTLANLLKDPAFSDLSDNIATAESEFEVAALAKITKASSSDWKAAAWLLERRRPKDYKLQTTTEIEGAAAVAVIGYTITPPEG